MIWRGVGLGLLPLAALHTAPPPTTWREPEYWAEIVTVAGATASVGAILPARKPLTRPGQPTQRGFLSLNPEGNKMTQSARARWCIREHCVEQAGDKPHTLAVVRSNSVAHPFQFRSTCVARALHIRYTCSVVLRLLRQPYCLPAAIKPINLAPEPGGSSFHSFQFPDLD